LKPIAIESLTDVKVPYKHQVSFHMGLKHQALTLQLAPKIANGPRPPCYYYSLKTNKKNISIIDLSSFRR